MRWRRPFGRCLPPVVHGCSVDRPQRPRPCHIFIFYSSRYKYAQKSEVQKVSESLCWRSLCLLVPRIQCAGPISGLAYLRLDLRVAGRASGEGAAPSRAAPGPPPPSQEKGSKPEIRPAHCFIAAAAARQAASKTSGCFGEPTTRSTYSLELADERLCSWSGKI